MTEERETKEWHQRRIDGAISAPPVSCAGTPDGVQGGDITQRFTSENDNNYVCMWMTVLEP